MNCLLSVEFKDYPSVAKTLLMPTIPKLDDVDRRILRELRRDGRLSNAKLAEHVGLSATPCWNRVRALEESGVIEGYAALLNQKALGLPDTVLIEVTLDRHDDDMLHRFGQALAELPEVLEAHLLTGEYDYLIKVAVAGTEGYEEFLRHKLYKLPGLRHSHSTFVLRTLKRELSVAP
uniref:Transcriptional regulator, AsnC family n=2 Tax=Cupriavidus TaxID=106589 RepID=Q46TD9_CUPPJ